VDEPNRGTGLTQSKWKNSKKPHGISGTKPRDRGVLRDAGRREKEKKIVRLSKKIAHGIKIMVTPEGMAV